MKELRITKYNPQNRDSNGAYLDQNGWTCFSEVGEKLTLEEYEKVENAYIDSAIELIFHHPEDELFIRGLEEHDGPSGLSEGDRITETSMPTVLKKVLRNECWCRLESESNFIHIGYDYYMYVGASVLTKNNLATIEARGLYVESSISPYNNKTE